MANRQVMFTFPQELIKEPIIYNLGIKYKVVTNIRRADVSENKGWVVLELEGEEILFSDGWEGDSINNSAVWVPSIGVACATDIAFHDCHLWPIESNVARRVIWRKDIARLKEFDARIIIPGHCDDEKIDLMEEVQEDKTRAYTECVDWSIDYLDNYEEIYSSAESAEDLVTRMYERYPNVKAEDFAVQWQARLLFPHSSPDWLLPLPGEPGKIFLNPSGGFDGDPPKE